VADIEIYTKEWCPYCARAKVLLTSKGLEYRETDITRDQEREREMISRSGFRTVPQIFLDGESVGGYDALATINATGEFDRRLGLPAVTFRAVYDVAVIGAGPAGLVAALYAARKNLSVVLVSLDIGGQVGTTRELLNYPGIRGITGPGLVQEMHGQLQEHEVDQLIGERVVGIRLMPGIVIADTLSGKEVCARALIIASGAQKRHLGIPGEKEFAGRGVVYCSTCDGPLFRDLAIAIVGGGNSGLEAALEMEGTAKTVYLISRGPLSGDQVLQDKLVASQVMVLADHEPVEIYGEEQVAGLTVRDRLSRTEKRLEVDGVFVEIGLRPHTEFILDLLETNDAGEIVVDAHGRTGVPGIFAAGDAIDIHDKQIVMAAGQGARAALAAFEYLVKRT
jgi:NADH-dependent peroxiredoxin subunit F